MSKRDKEQLKKIFDKMCKKDQYISHFRGCKITSYNDYKNEQILLIFTTTINGHEMTNKSFITDSDYHNFDLQKLYDLFIDSNLKNLRNFMVNFN